MKKCTLGLGCFWKPEENFKNKPGIIDTEVGYAGGHNAVVSYEEVCKGNTNHAEVVQVAYNPKEVSFKELLTTFWDNHNPTTLNRQGNDIGTQYRSAIFYHSDSQMNIAIEHKNDIQNKFKSSIVTEIIAKEKFYRAEEYHQQYISKNNLGLCGV